MILKSIFFINPFSSMIKKSHDKNLNILKSGSHLSKTYLFHWKPFKSDKKCFLFSLKSSIRFQDI